MVEPINTETRVMEGVRFSPNFVAGWNSCLFAIRSNSFESVSHKEAARMIEDAANSITTKEAAIDLYSEFLKKSPAIHRTLTDKLDTYVGETNV